MNEGSRHDDQVLGDGRARAITSVPARCGFEVEEGQEATDKCVVDGQMLSAVMLGACLLTGVSYAMMNVHGSQWMLEEWA